MARKNYVAIPPKSLKTDVLSTDSTFKIRDIVWYTGSDGVDVNLAASDFGTDQVGYGVFEPRTAREEWFTFSSANMATATTTGLTISARGLIRTAPYTTEATARKFNHEAGSTVLLYTNSPAFYDDFANKDNDEVITGQWRFPTGANYPTVGASYSAPTADEHVATKKYADDLAIAGAPNGSTTVKGIFEEATVAEQGSATATGATGARLVVANANLVKTSSGAGDENKIAVLDASGTFANGFIDKARTWGTVQSFTADNCQITTDADSSNDAVRYSMLQSVSTSIPVGAVSGTSGEAITAGQGLYVKASDGKLYKSIGTGDESTYSFVGIAFTTVAGADLAVTFCPPGHTVTGLAGLTAGSYYYVTDTAGTLGTTPGTRYAKVGHALSTTVMRVLDPKFIRSGSVSIAGTNTSVVTTGFYPARVLVRAGYTGDSISVGDDTNSCVYTERNGAAVVNEALDGSNAWRVYRGAGPNTGTGTITTKTATSFRLDQVFSYGGTTTINWTAFSE